MLLYFPTKKPLGGCQTNQLCRKILNLGFATEPVIQYAEEDPEEASFDFKFFNENFARPIRALTGVFDKWTRYIGLKSLTFRKFKMI